MPESMTYTDYTQTGTPKKKTPQYSADQNQYILDEVKRRTDALRQMGDTAAAGQHQILYQDLSGNPASQNWAGTYQNLMSSGWNPQETQQQQQQQQQQTAQIAADPTVNPIAQPAVEAMSNITQPGTTFAEQQNLLMNPAFGAVQQGYQAAGQAATPEQLFNLAKGTLTEDFNLAQQQNMENINRMGGGGATVGFGAAQGTPYDLANRRYAEALSNMALQANVQAPMVSQQLAGGALGMGQGLYGQRAASNQAIADRQYQTQMDAAMMEQQKRAQQQGMWGDIGGALLGTAGTLGGFALGGPAGGMLGGNLFGGLFGGGGAVDPGADWAQWNAPSTGQGGNYSFLSPGFGL